MKRRSFLKYSSALSLPVMLGKMPAFGYSGHSNDGYEDRILVIIQLIGGNDGLASLVPLDQYDALANVRSNIIIPENQLLPISDTLAFHPNLNGLRSLYDNGKLKILQSVGYPDQDRSHFRSKDIWHSASSAQEVETTGWIGRYLDSQYPNYPSAYPNEDYTDPFAVTVGTSTSETCEGQASNFSITVNDPERINAVGGQQVNDLATGCASDNLDFINESIIKNNKYGERLSEAYDAGTNMSDLYADDRLSEAMKTIARLISGGLQSKVYVASIGGFDTHADQVVGDNPQIGEHAELMSSIGTAIEAFQDDIEKLGIDEQILGMTYSEFGRRIRSNDSYGTDHGDAAPLFVFGSCVEGGVIGNNPEISVDATVLEGVPMQIDFRSIYGSIFIDWFGQPEDTVNTLIPHDFQKLPIAGNCSIVNTVNITEEFISISPNPTTNNVNIYTSRNLGEVNISVLNDIGHLVFSSRTTLQRIRGINLDMSNYRSGVYFVRIQNSQFQKVVRLVKI